MKERVLEAYLFHGQYLLEQGFQRPLDRGANFTWVTQNSSMAEPLNDFAKIHSDDDIIC